MIDQAGIRMAQGESIAGERISGVNDNMKIGRASCRERV